MVGIFDSGVGGFNALEELRRLSPECDICYYADRANAPYGTKDEKTLISLVKNDIDILLSEGVTDVLIACCTACTVYPHLPEEYRKIALPIIEPAAYRAVSLTDCGHVAVLSTFATARSGAFVHAIKKYDGAVRVTARPSARLVSIVEAGAKDGMFNPGFDRVIEEELYGICDSGADVIILGCTHFSHIKEKIEQYSGMRAVSAAHEGAALMAKRITSVGRGRIKYIGKKDCRVCGENGGHYGKIQTGQNK